MKSNLVLYRNNESEESGLIAPKKNSFVSQSMGYFFCGNGFIQ